MTTRDLLAAEWTKAVTLRSTLACAALAPLLAAALGVLLGHEFGGHALRSGPAVDPLFPCLYGLTLAQIPLVALGVLLTGGENRSGTIGAALLATPRRGTLHTAKALAVTAMATPLAAATVAASFLAARAGLGRRAPAWTDPAVPAALAGAVLYLVLICLLGAAAGTLLAGTAAPLGVLLPLLLLGSQGLGNIPGLRAVTQYLPDQTAQPLLHLAGPQSVPNFHRDYGPWTGLGLTAAWTAAALLAARLALRRRDIG
ncbi:hypothetical protein BIV57_09735 [Mangrovactinospora gilvigrisea]|uniref:ABC transporter permease n=1 Tax=Mangrovactinospora gilvigrisea TaxID=1428644 RepID=A0A1J7BG76_9ACTN|nr:hypothetical protein [Mangrovactinospora gilvigrisea]OIV37646.1 hypothetical protein BIV57_09735 [Mangrovactinospora gilvigrisea]